MSAPIAVLFGTETGNSQDCAERLATAIRDLGFSAESIDMGHYDADRLGGEALALIVTSTYGNGDPPANAEALLNHVSNTSTQLEGVSFGVCALGDSTYPLFAQCGRDFDERMEKRGARRVIELVECDGGFDYDEPFEEFKELCLAYVQDHWNSEASEQGVSPQPTVQATVQPEAPASEVGDRASARLEVAARLSERHRLTGAGSGKDTWHVVFTLESSTAYEPGDCFSVNPVNDPDEVASVLRWLGEPEGTGVEQQLSAECCLQRVTTELVAGLSPFSATAAALDADRSSLGGYAREHHVLDLLSDAPEGSLASGQLLGCLRPLAPRVYSIASSPLRRPDEVHFTVDAVRYERHGRPLVGVASTWLTERLELGASTTLTLHTNPRFRLPSGDQPVIMIGPGTGIAPFRGFLEELEAREASNPTWLFFGHRSAATDFLYGDEVEAHLWSSRLNHLTTAWSRDQPEKVYVQDRIRESARELWLWISEGAHVYVCGDAAHMAPGVRAALQEVAVEQGSVVDPVAWLEAMRDEGRYAEDVY
ncbi:MAG: sulfite reductase flavoprotein subunit alpha [Planctomycetota bacterium]|nr:sulfite reductase flavoprotein subunit alpha [Planctomycetota bacterium]